MALDQDGLRGQDGCGTPGTCRGLLSTSCHMELACVEKNIHQGDCSRPAMSTWPALEEAPKAAELPSACPTAAQG